MNASCLKQLFVTSIDGKLKTNIETHWQVYFKDNNIEGQVFRNLNTTIY